MLDDDSPLCTSSLTLDTHSPNVSVDRMLSPPTSPCCPMGHLAFPSARTHARPPCPDLRSCAGFRQMAVALCDVTTYPYHYCGRGACTLSLLPLTA